MRAPRPTGPSRDRALALVEHFGRKLLPGVLRRIGAWKGIPPRQLADLQEDVLQELRVDCLRDAAELEAMTARERHARWMQLSERTVYRMRRHLRRCTSLQAEPCGPAGETSETRLQLPNLVTLNNGRANVAESARAAGLGRRAMRQHLDDLAAQLGWCGEQRRFWRTRAAEALIGLAADSLRTAGEVRELSQPRPPDLAARRARLQRVARMIPVQPATLEERRALQPWVRRPRPDPPPEDLLRSATALAPELAAGWLWLFEARVAAGDAQSASACLRRAGACSDAARSSVVLARARLLQVRGCTARALAMLDRARTRRDPDRRIEQALDLFNA